MKKIFYGKQFIDDNDVEEVIKVLKSDYLTQGPFVDEFEKNFAIKLGVKYAVSFCNGTSALHAAYFAAGLKEGDEIITSTLTFVATGNAALFLGADVKLVDIDYNNYCIDIDKIEEKITNKTKIIVPVSYGGYPSNIKRIKEIAKKYNLLIIEDAAHALGAERENLKIGQEADMTMFSFHPIKHITTGEGGMICTNNLEYYKKLKLFRSHGITKDNLTKKDGDWYYEMKILGYNYRMNDIQAALGNSQLKKLDYFVEKRRKIAKIYDEAFMNLNIRLPLNSEKYKNSYHLYPILIDNRNEIFAMLKENNIFCQVNYIPIHMQVYYKEKYKFLDSDYPISKKFYEKEISLPMYPSLKEEEQEYIIKKFLKIFQLFEK